MNTLAVIKQMPESKAQVQDFVSRAVNEITSGSINPIDISIYLKAMEDVIKAIRSNEEVKNRIISALEFTEDGKVTIDNGTVSIVESTRLDYSNDPVWSDLDSQEQGIKEKKKSREAILKTVTENVAGTEDVGNPGVILQEPVKQVIQTVRVNLR